VAKVKLTKTELRMQQAKLKQLQRYLPTLQLKKALLQMEVNNANAEFEENNVLFTRKKKEIKKYASLFTDIEANDLFASTEVEAVSVKRDNIAGLEVPHFESIVFAKKSYRLFDAPIWLDFAVDEIKKLVSKKEKIRAILEKKTVLEGELREVSIRVNLFEKVMIPRALENIKMIKIFLSDQQLAAVAQAKIAKKKIEERKAK
jgi:V/A-type H+/Na+-transporting ATPase subunit D